MTSQIFEDWIPHVDPEMRQRNIKICLIMDNASCHLVSDWLTNIVVLDISPNTSVLIRPLEQGVIRSFKVKYRNLQVNHLLFHMNSFEGGDCGKSIDLLRRST